MIHADLISFTATEKQFIRDHLTADVQTLLLRARPARLDVKKLAAQITARQKARYKLATWYANDDLIFPPALSVEQASSEAAAHYKALLVGGALLLDLTGGMGVDARAFADRVTQVLYAEQQPDLAQLAAHNLPLLGATNVTVQTGDGLAMAGQLSEPADWLYLDPHRRNGQGGKMVRLDQCEPDVSRPGILKNLLTKTRNILLKTSPLIDIEAAIRQLSGQGYGVESVHVVAVLGEVKEVLFVISHAQTDVPDITSKAINVLPDSTTAFSFVRSDERTADVVFGDPQTYLYEPNAAVLKAGAFRSVAERFGLIKLAPNTHLYTSNERVKDFPGRAFVVEQALRPDRKAVQMRLPDLKANLTVRNFPQTVADLRKKLALREGGDAYLFAATLLNGDKRLILCRKVAA